MTWKVASLVLYLGAFAAARENGWSTLETEDNYVDYPPEVQEKADNQLLTFRDDNFELPTFRAFQAFPEYGRLNLWPLLKGMNTRMNPVMWPHVHYYVDDGLEFGCRSTDEENNQEIPVTTAHCHRHCINGGRYCAPQTEDDLPEGREGHDVLKEIVRRLCMDDIYHSKDPRFIAYLEEFDAQDCFASEHIRGCSIDALEKVGMHFSQIEACLQEDTYDDDVPHTILDRNAKHLDGPLNGEYYIDDLPAVSINGNASFWKELTVEYIFQSYCDAFPKDNIPVACETCARCDDDRTCLWTLTCNGSPALPGMENNDPPRHVDDAVDKLDEQISTSSANLEKSSEGSGAGGKIFLAFFIVLLVVGVVGAALYVKKRRIKEIHRKTEAVQEAVTSDESEEDEEDERENNVYRERAQQLLSEVATGKYGIYGGEKLAKTPTSPIV